MKMVNERTRTMSAVNDERRQVLPSKVIWYGTIDRLEVFRNNDEVYFKQIGAAYLFDSSFQEVYLERVLSVMVIFWMNFFLLSRSRRMHTHHMAHYLVHARVV
jgi:hypothetical protein